MELSKILVFSLVLVLGVSMVLAEDSWDSINTDNSSDSSTNEDSSSTSSSSSEDSATVNDSLDDSSSTSSSARQTSSSSSDESFIYTENFYLAIGVAGFGVLILILLVFLFLHKPQNKWKKVES